MDQCSRCGALMTADAGWCGQCYAPRAPVVAPAPLFSPPVPAAATSAATALAAQPGTDSGGAPVRATPVKSEGPALLRTRWRKTPTTFGPTGRLLCTLGLVLGLAFFVAGGIITGGMTLIGAGIWGFVIMPWALRDVWRAGTIPRP